jgi:hypothetical protein
MQVVGAGWAHREVLECTELINSFRDLTVDFREGWIVLSSRSR